MKGLSVHLERLGARLRERENRSLVVGTVLLVLAGPVLVLACTRHGVGIGGDGIVYIAAARNLARGEGLSWIGPGHSLQPLVHFPPLFPFLLSLLGRLGLDPLVGARWLNAVLDGITVCLVISALFWATRQAWVALLSGVLVVFSPEMLALHTGAASEPVFLALILASLVLLVAYLDGGDRRRLILSAVAVGLAYLARYAGLMFAGAYPIALLGLGQRPWRRRLGDALLYSVIAGTFIVALMLRNQIVRGTTTGRGFSLLLPPPSLFVLVADVISYWFLPERLALALRMGVVITGGVLLGVAWFRFGRPGAVRQMVGRREELFLAVVAGAMVIYAGGLLVARSIIVPRVTIDGRLLAPVHFLLLLLVMTMISAVSRSRDLRRILVAIIAAGSFLFAASYIVRGTIRALVLQSDGQGYASRAWRTSPLINALRLLPPETPIYTNEVEALYLLADRYAYRLPSGCLPDDPMATVQGGESCRTPAYLAWSEAMRERLVSDRAVLAIFNSYTDQRYYAAVVPELAEGLAILSRQGDGTLYVYDRSQWPDNPNW